MIMKLGEIVGEIQRSHHSQKLNWIRTSSQTQKCQRTQESIGTLDLWMRVYNDNETS